MSEPTKMFSVIFPYKTFEKLQTVAKAREMSMGKAVRVAVDFFLRNLPDVEVRTMGEND